MHEPASRLEGGGMGEIADGYTTAIIAGFHEHKVISKKTLCSACDVIRSVGGSST